MVGLIEAMILKPFDLRAFCSLENEARLQRPLCEDFNFLFCFIVCDSRGGTQVSHMPSTPWTPKLHSVPMSILTIRIKVLGVKAEKWLKLLQAHIPFATSVV